MEIPPNGIVWPTRFRFLKMPSRLNTETTPALTARGSTINPCRTAPTVRTHRVVRAAPQPLVSPRC